jgi:hypothetical protein
MKSRLISVVVMATLLTITVSAFCQTPNPPLVAVTRAQVKPDRVQEYQELQKQATDSYKKAAIPGGFRVVYRTVVGNSVEFWILTPMSKYADRDSESPVNKVTTEVERATRNMRLLQCIERSQSSIEQTIADLTVIGTGVKMPATFVRVTRTRIRPNTANDYINTLKTEVIPIVKKLNGMSLVHRVAWGGNQNEFVSVNGFEKWAELDDTTSFQKAIGEQALRRLQEKLSAIVSGSERSIMRYQPDLSYYPAASGSAAGR